MRYFFLILLCFLSFAPSVQAADEGAGLIRSDLNGALPKGLWRNQNRSEIAYLIQNMPDHAPSRAMQTIKRNMLVSVYDTRGIINDVSAEDGRDLLSLRLKALLKNGFWEDAFKLYTNSTDDPGTNSALAEIGLLLILNKQGLSTACLEEKVLFERYSSEPFWQQLDKVCSIEMGMGDKTEIQFPNSSVLQGLYFDSNFKIAANDINLLEKLEPLELSLLAQKGRIDYTSLDLSQSISPILTKTFLNDEKFPAAQKGKLENLALFQALLPFEELSKAQKEKLEDPSTLPQSELLPLIITQLRLGQKISEESGKRLMELAPNNPENYFFTKVLQDTQNIYGNYGLEKDNINLAIEELGKKHPQDEILLLSSLDKPVLFSNNPKTVYEKQISLTPDDGYVMSNTTPSEWLELTTKSQFAGLSLLIVLSNIENNANGINDNNVIKSLSTVGLINQAHLIAKEKLVEMMKASI